MQGKLKSTTFFIVPKLPCLSASCWRKWGTRNYQSLSKRTTKLLRPLSNRKCSVKILSSRTCDFGGWRTSLSNNISKYSGILILTTGQTTSQSTLPPSTNASYVSNTYCAPTQPLLKVRQNLFHVFSYKGVLQCSSHSICQSLVQMRQCQQIQDKAHNLLMYLITIISRSLFKLCD